MTPPPPTPQAAPGTSGQGPAPLGGAVGHYENFPVASWLCPAHLRPAVAAIYHFARTADDIADEGDATAEVRLADLAAYREDLAQSLQPASASAPSRRWPQVFGPLALAARRHALPPEPLHDLISAFEQDVRHTANAHRCADMAELLAYCRLSANPVGRLLLHLYGVRDEVALQQSDQICSALQLINFWQDLSVDLPRQRCYLPADVLRRHGAQVEDFLPAASGHPDSPAGIGRQQAVVAELCAYARGLMLQGAPLALRVPGRAGWELRLVVQGGLAVLDAIAAQQHRSWQTRVKLSRADLPRLAWRALWM
ncbi:squalene synthase HpnC [Hydrogenophaga sp.]|uniref:squalene synthase HpnC n=1 Tax=Hydrogenophaga sp. TaxID=1904254 RepID=UPI00261A0ECF|nr:squalene synthase HpnC [Hydrogenophaga sp.]MCW5655601.1 squalene synthase HpnC [Hydrogenophaga sp.]